MAENPADATAQENAAKTQDSIQELAELGPGVHRVKKTANNVLKSCVVVGQARISTVLGKSKAEKDHKYDVTGSLCENNDKFAIDRELPEIEEGDILVIHDTGAHGHAMGFNYNGKMRHAEYLKNNGKILRIRRDETYEDYIRTQLLDPVEV